MSAITDKIMARAKEIHEAADGLKQKIIAFEQCITTMPGRVETMIILNNARDVGFTTLTVHMRRDGKQWKLFCARGNNEGVAEDYKELKEASLSSKLTFVENYELLLKAMHKKQDTLIRQIEESAKGLDEFLKTVKKEADDAVHSNG